MDQHNLRATLDAAEARLGEAATHYLDLATDPDWKLAGSTNHQPRPEVQAQHHKASAPPSPVNDDVLVYLSYAESEVLDLEGRIRARQGRQPRRESTVTPAVVLSAMVEVKTALPTLDEELFRRAFDLAFGLERRGSALRGLRTPTRAVADCPTCGSRSIVIDPRDDDRALCANPSCRDQDGARHAWSRAAGEWTHLGWPADTRARAAFAQLTPALPVDQR